MFSDDSASIATNWQKHHWTIFLKNSMILFGWYFFPPLCRLCQLNEYLLKILFPRFWVTIISWFFSLPDFHSVTFSSVFLAWQRSEFFATVMFFLRQMFVMASINYADNPHIQMLIIWCHCILTILFSITINVNPLLKARWSNPRLLVLLRSLLFLCLCS